MRGFNKMEVARIVLKVVMWVLIIGFGCNFMMQTISYFFYKGAKQMSDISCTPVKIQLNDKLTGYGYNLDVDSNQVILYFGGSNYIAYNSVGKFATYYDVPFISADYYGTQDSVGKMNLKSMQQTARDLYDYVADKHPGKEIIVMGHSYGSGMAAYLASVRQCKKLVLLAAYTDVSDLYNKIIPIFWGPVKVFISNNMKISEYAKKTTCKAYIIGSYQDKTLGAELQKKVSHCYNKAEVKIFEGIEHEQYLIDEQVVDYITNIMEENNGF